MAIVKGIQQKPIAHPGNDKVDHSEKSHSLWHKSQKCSTEFFNSLENKTSKNLLPMAHPGDDRVCPKADSLFDKRAHLSHTHTGNEEAMIQAIRDSKMVL